MTTTWIQVWLRRTIFISHVEYLNYHNHHQLCMLGTLHEGGKFKASLPADHVYGMFGLPALESMSQAIVPDYTKGHQSLFQQVARLSVEQQGNLDALSFVQHSGGISLKYPTWVAQWDKEICISPLFHPSNFSRGLYDASRSSSVQTVFSGDYMISTGVCVDSIQTRLESDYSYWSSPELYFADIENHPLLTFIRKNAKAVNKYICSSTILAYGRYLVGGAEGTFHDDDSERAVDFCQFVIELMKAGGESPDSYSDFETETEGVWQLYRAYVACKLWNRCLFRTENGYMGSGRDLLRAGENPKCWCSHVTCYFRNFQLQALCKASNVVLDPTRPRAQMQPGWKPKAWRYSVAGIRY
ncbi:hypothetical protein BU16DRAFT_237232 [Lophium mytilinum]|uniref:Uncharacterized protein n=1 Tax=Lophium mytilinum TaxID=390894 RepID=A0A6A6R6Y8_9PEZI|nr:hypothetical protein BU16DRAFT_237232 [Lophium mytilinum]